MSHDNVSVSGGQERTRWQMLWEGPRRWYLFWVPMGGILMFVVGIIFWAGFNTMLEATNNEQFCISCHEMRDNTYMEYKGTIHDKNRTGVRATCPDCHVPKPFFLKMKRKLQASAEVWAKITGAVDTRAKFLEERKKLAEHQWMYMKSVNSRECMNCHSFAAMDPDKQDPAARRKHSAEYIRENDKTCIDCHKGIAHHLPGTDPIPGAEASTKQP